MKSLKIVLAAMLFQTLLLAEDEKSDLSISGNVALTSNYMWRGMTQSNSSPAIQGGFDIGYKKAYVGVWGSSVDFEGNEASAEFDIYGGYADEMYGIGYDIGVMAYTYPKATKELDFGEVYLGLSKDFEVVKVGVKGYKAFKTNTVDNLSDAYEFSLSAPLPQEFNAEALYGDYIDYGNYYLVGVSKTLKEKFKISLAYTGINGRDGKVDENSLVAAIKATF